MEAVQSEHEIGATVEVMLAPNAVPPPSTSPPPIPSDAPPPKQNVWQRLRRLWIAALLRGKQWLLEDGRWYLSSAFAFITFCSGLIATMIPQRG